MSDLEQKDRVEHTITGHKGRVECVDSYHVRVKWDDGKTGLLYRDDSVPNVKYLHKILEN